MSVVVVVIYLVQGKPLHNNADAYRTRASIHRPSILASQQELK